MKKDKPLLTISIMTSNRMDTIPRCLDSLKPILEAIPSELIITDTSQNPDVRELVLKYTDNVIPFEWCNDFAKARNVGLEQAQGEWFMFIDDDEWFLDAQPLIDFFQSGQYKDYGYVHYRVRNYMDLELETFEDTWVSRMVKLQEDTKFHSKVHEYLAPYVGKDLQIPCLVGHTGYIFQEKEDKKKHFERNFSLLKKMEEEEPDVLRWKVQIIQEYRFNADWEGLEEYCEKAIDYLSKGEHRVNLFDFLQLHVGYAMALVNNNKFEEVEPVYKKCKSLMKNTLLANAYLESLVAEAFYNLKDYEKMREYASKYVKGYKTYHKNPAAYEKERIKLILGETFTEKKYCAVNSLLLASELELENRDSIYTIYPELMWTNDNARVYYDIDNKIVSALLEMGDDDMLRRVLKDALSSYNIKYRMLRLIQSWKEKDEVAYIKLLGMMVETVEVEGWMRPYAKLLTLTGEEAQEEITGYASEYMQHRFSMFNIQPEIRAVFESHNIIPEEIYATYDFVTWKKLLLNSLDHMSMEDVENTKSNLENSVLQNDVRFGYFMIVYAEQKLKKGIQEELSLDAYSDLLYTFSQYTRVTYEALFGAQLQKMELEDMPENYQAALWLKLYFEEIDTDLKSALACLGKVAEAYPMFSGVMRYYLGRIKQEMFE